MQRLAILVDVQNMYYTVRQQYGAQFNYRALWEEVTEGRTANFAFAYAIARPDAKQQKFQQALRNIGFEVKLKPYLQRSDGSAKGDWDVGIALDMIEYAPMVDVMVMASGDGDMTMAVERVQDRYRIPVEVYGVEPLTANNLIKAAGRFRPIDEELLLR